MSTLPLDDPDFEEAQVRDYKPKPTKVETDDAGDYIRIAIGYNRWLKVDPEDYVRVRKLRWYVRTIKHTSRKTGNDIEKINIYTVVTRKGKLHNLPLTRFIMKTDEKTRVRFRTNDRYDYRKSNLWAGGYRALEKMLDDLPIETWLEATDLGAIENAGRNKEELRDVPVLDTDDE